ncbi:uncharacterized protein LOC100743840 [Bombus impatiens]|uniref:Uncharacterized protein LOC100743840 n=1 Tax=Bombus impatiens TaxID=132113 RepID=A0A6P3E3M3_BOMIM|nr:uncharacterized protein LOC100743840 [Bombus impatiens]
MMTFAKSSLISCLLGILLWEIHGQGIMVDPISRSSAWRKGFPVEVNVNDHELSCGGPTIQFTQNDGLCGICGDDYAIPRPRPNENGGRYGTGVIVQRYRVNDTVNVNVKLISNDLGSFSFSLCPLEGPKDFETEMCFKKYPLQLENTDNAFLLPNYQKDFYIRVQLPSNLICEHCVFRWTYVIGNHATLCYGNTVKIGCAPQKTFKNCADIAISS